MKICSNVACKNKTSDHAKVCPKCGKSFPVSPTKPDSILTGTPFPERGPNILNSTNVFPTVVKEVSLSEEFSKQTYEKNNQIKFLIICLALLFIVLIYWFVVRGDRVLNTNDSYPAVVQAPKSKDVISLQQSSTQFINKYYSIINSKSDSLIMEYLNSSYAQNIDFYNTNINKSNLLKQKSDYLKRWPLRSYVPRSSENSIECDVKKRICAVKGVLDWNLRSPERNSTSVGVAEFEFTLYFDNQNILIIRENGKVLQRNIY
jgi:hypothetical protein